MPDGPNFSSLPKSSNKHPFAINAPVNSSNWQKQANVHVFVAKFTLMLKTCITTVLTVFPCKDTIISSKEDFLFLLNSIPEFSQ